MEHQNCQVEPVKMIVDFLSKNVTRILGVMFLLVVFSACSVMQDSYLFPDKPLYRSDGTEAKILFQKFSEDFLNDTDAVGLRRVGSKQKKIKIMKGEVATTLHSRIAICLADKNYPTRLTGEKLWNLTANDLERQSGASILLGGKIRKFSVQVSTIVTRLRTEYEFQIEVDCYIGKVDSKKVIKRTVRFGQKMLNISPSQKTMDSFLNNFMQEAALQVVENIESFLRE